MRYAFFPDARRLLIERDGKLSTYDSGDHQISGVQQSGDLPTFTSQNGAVRLVLLRHKRSGGGFWRRIVWQHGHRVSLWQGRR